MSRQIAAQVYSRTCGYFAMVANGDKSGNWNRGKTEEYSERLCVKVPDLTSLK